jgi:hypothetical protein
MTHTFPEGKEVSFQGQTGYFLLNDTALPGPLRNRRVVSSFSTCRNLKKGSLFPVVSFKFLSYEKSLNGFLK